MTLAEYRTRLALVESKINEILTNGTAYTVVGSHSITNPALAELRREEAFIRKRLLILQGYDTSRRIPNFNG